LDEEIHPHVVVEDLGRVLRDVADAANTGRSVNHHRWTELLEKASDDSLVSQVVIPTTRNRQSRYVTLQPFSEEGTEKSPSAGQQNSVVAERVANQFDKFHIGAFPCAL